MKKMFMITLLSMAAIIMVSSNPLSTLFVGFAILLLTLLSEKTNNEKSGLLSNVTVLFIFFLIVKHYLINNDINTFVDNVKFGLHLGGVLGGGHTINETFHRVYISIRSVFSPHIFIKQNYAILSIIIVWHLFRVYVMPRFRFIKGDSSEANNVAFILIILIYILARFNNPQSYGFDMIHLIIILAVATLFNSGGWSYLKKIISNIAIKDHLVFWIILGLPLIFRIGTNNDIIRISFAGSFFYLIFIFLIIAIVFNKYNLVSRAIVLVLVSAILIKINLYSFNKPYRLVGPISEQRNNVEMFCGSTELLVDDETASWVMTLQTRAVENGWYRDNYLIDFTGGTPGAAVVLGAQSPGAAWLIGGYPGSDQYVYEILPTIDKAVLRSSWLLTAPDGKRAISGEVLTQLDINLEEYDLVTRDVSGHRNEVQYLWKPRN